MHRVSESEAKPHGLDYWLTLHGPEGDRLVDSTTPIACAVSRNRAEGQGAYDHRHTMRTVRPYDYRGAATLLGDFWTEVDAVLREKGVFK